MQAAQYYGNRDIRVENVDEPSPDEGEVLIDVDACGICGSDVGEYLHGPRSDDRVPYTMGHEVGGTIAETGDDVDIEVGTEIVLNPLVACENCPRCAESKYNLCENLEVIGAQRSGAYAERVTAPAGNVVSLPDGVSPEMAAVSEPVTVAFHALMQSPLRPGQSVAVVGLGPIGLGLVQLAKAAGAGPVYASGHREARRELARECGADVVIDPRETDPIERIRDETDGGVDVAFEVAGKESALNDAIKATKPSGHTTLVGVFKGPVEFEPMDLVNNERSVNASAAYHTGPLADRDFGAVLQKIATGAVDPELLVTSRIALEDISDDGFEALVDGDSEEVKVLVRP
ncbi:2,3-butanediol dehydrogenase [Halostagnicola bangensis]